MVVPALLPFLLLSMVGCTESGLGSGSAEPAADEWTYLGQNYSSTYTNHGESVISTSNVAQLELDWHFIPRGTVNGAATVVNGVVYVMSGARLYALDPVSRTVLWESTTVSGTSTPTYDGGRLFIQTGRGEVVSLDAATGTELWRSDVDPHPLSVGFSSPLVFERFVVVGSSSIEETAAIENATFTGSMVAFDRETGEELWRFYTAVLPINGASIWSSPSLDPELRLVYGSTGNNYTEIAGPTSDSIFALEVDTGNVRWLTQLTEGDIFTIPNQVSEDTDFGTNPILYDAVVDGESRKMLAAGQKSGVFWALDRETGEVLWETAVSPGSPLVGGFLNNGAYDGERILAVGSTGSSTAPGSEDPPPGTFRRGRLVALDPATGDIIWERQIPGWTFAPVTSANGVGYVAVDDTIQAFDARTGQKLYSFKTPGTISCAPVAAEGRLHFGSGITYILTTPAQDFYILSLDGRGESEG